MKTKFIPSTEPNFGALWIGMSLVFKLFGFYVNHVKTNLTWNKAKAYYPKFIIPWMKLMEKFCPENCEWLRN
jgi:hypothetical protein